MRFCLRVSPAGQPLSGQTLLTRAALEVTASKSFSTSSTDSMRSLKFTVDSSLGTSNSAGTNWRFDRELIITLY
jgi:hypothetical protein